MTLTELVERFKDQTAGTGINEFVFDDLSTVNTDVNKSFPLLLFKPPNHSIQDIKSSATYDQYSIEIFTFDLYQAKEQETKDLQQKWTDLKDITVKYIQKLPLDSDIFFTDKVINFELGHFMHNQQLIGIKSTFLLSVLECYT